MELYANIKTILRCAISFVMPLSECVLADVARKQARPEKEVLPLLKRRSISSVNRSVNAKRDRRRECLPPGNPISRTDNEKKMKENTYTYH